MALVIPPALVTLFIATNINTGPLESDILTYRILENPDGLGYYDPVTLTAPLGVVDYGKLTLASKDTSYLSNRVIQGKDMTLGAKVTIGDKTAFYNKKFYDEYSVLASTGLAGAGGANRFAKQIPVIVDRDGARALQTAFVEVVQIR